MGDVHDTQVKIRCAPMMHIAEKRLNYVTNWFEIYHIYYIYNAQNNYL